MKNLTKSKLFLQVFVASVVATLATVGIVAAATTIGANVNTTGTLDASGQTTLNQASSTMVTVSGMTYLNGGLAMDGTTFTVADVSGNTSIGGILSVAGAVSLSSTLTLGDTASTTGSAIIKTAVINSDTGLISFSDENLSTTGNVSFATGSSTGLTSLQSLKVSSGGDTVSDIQFGTCVVGFGGILGAGSATTTNCTATGVSLAGNYKVFLTPSNLETQVSYNSASTTADNTIQVQIFNTSTTTTIVIFPHTWSWMAIK